MPDEPLPLLSLWGNSRSKTCRYVEVFLGQNAIRRRKEYSLRLHASRVRERNRLDNDATWSRRHIHRPNQLGAALPDKILYVLDKGRRALRTSRRSSAGILLVTI